MTTIKRQYHAFIHTVDGSICWTLKAAQQAQAAIERKTGDRPPIHSYPAHERAVA